MLSVLIETKNDEEGLARTLASLIGGAVEGIVRDVIVCDAGSTDQTRSVAEHAGCHVISEGGLVAGLVLAKADWLMMLEPGARLVDGWTEGVLDHVAKADRPARFSRARDDRRRLFSRLWTASTALAEGLVIRKVQATALAKTAGSAETMARRISPMRLTSTIRVAQKRLTAAN